MKQLYTVNRLVIKGRSTSKVVFSQSNRGNSEKEARNYGREIAKKGVDREIWEFVGLVYSEVENVQHLTRNYGTDDSHVLKKTGIDVTKMGIFANTGIEIIHS